MPNGTLVPIEADSQGRLVAEGLTGPQGPAGPPGVGELPPNPQNGDILAWDDGLVWVSGIIPAFPPKTDVITAVNSGAQTTLTFASDKALADFAPGDYIEQENSTGMPVFSSDLSLVEGSSSYNPLHPASNAFDGDTVTYAAPETITQINASSWDASSHNFSLSSFRVHAYTKENAVGNAGRIYFRFNNGSWQEFTNYAAGSNWIDMQAFLSIPDGTTLTEFGYRTDPDGAGAIGHDLRAIEVNGVVLVDGTGTTPSGTVGSVDVGARTMTLATSIGTWGPPNAGHYVIGPVQARYRVNQHPHR